jgi:coenzyme F420-reducing hydrogenase beta subunit
MNVNSISYNDCSGCKSCADICPEGSIAFVTDDKGFWFPVIEQNKCIDCGLCYNRCPVNTEFKNLNAPISVYACFNSNKTERLESTSGGAFTALAKVILEQKGVICGCRYTENFDAEHIIIDDEEKLNLLRQSKYYQSDTEKIYSKVKQYLVAGVDVLFAGTPCQNAGLRSFLNNQEYDNLYQTDFICRGIISPLVFHNYLSSLEKKKGAKAVSVQFKNKDYGWHRFGTKIMFENGEVYYEDRYHDSYMVSYLQYNLTIRDSCYNCKFKGVKRFSDLTLADFWGIEDVDNSMDQDLGTSMVMVNTIKGKRLFDSVENLVIKQKEVSDVINGNPYMLGTVPKSQNREAFFDLMNAQNYDAAIKRYAERPTYIRIYSKAKNLIKCIMGRN